MTTLTSPIVQPNQADPDTEALNLYQLGMLFVVKRRYWSYRAGNDPDDLVGLTGATGPDLYAERRIQAVPGIRLLSQWTPSGSQR